MRRHAVPGNRLRISLMAVLATAPFLLAVAPTIATASPSLRAELDGSPIALTDVSRYDCHDRAYPLIRCFKSPAERDADAWVMGAARETASNDASETPLAAASPYVRWYVDANFTGASFEAYYAYRDLGAIGWDDRISSFVPLSAGHPRWWRDIAFSGEAWDWGPGVPVAYVGGDANDRFSSVESR